jgi:peptidoglycan/xylan/chitin deacetylase (PgdA/CDA1 family)
MYHDAVTGDADGSGFSGPGPARYKLPWAKFVEHLDCMGEVAKGPPSSFEGVLRDDAQQTAPWLLTFDDAGTSALAIGEELVVRGWCGHFFIVASLMGTPGFLDYSGVRELHDMGHVIGSHSLTHPPNMSSLAPHQLRHEWAASVSRLSDLIGEEVRTASLPGGHYATAVAVAAARAGVAVLFTSEPLRRARFEHGCLVIGRFAIRGNTSARSAARAAEGRLGPWAGAYAAWTLRKPIKAIGGDHYDRVRTRMLTTLSKRKARETPFTNSGERQKR